MKKVLIRAFLNHNLGDDLFVYILCNRYKRTKFDIIGETKYKNIEACAENLHFISEDKRAGLLKDVLGRGDLEGFLSLISASGDSSYKYLQNVYTVKDPREEGLALAIRISEDYLRSIGGVCRVHGGGFAGTIQAFVPASLTDAYAAHMDAVFGAGACHILSVRKSGATRIL